MFKAMAVLLRNTTWKCGKIERLVVKYLQNHLRKDGRPWSNIKEMMQQFRLQGKQKSEFFDALRRLERRRIIKIETTELYLM
jgi:hypothetical protein